MSERKKLVFIGAGPSNLFAVLSLLEPPGSEELYDITVIDKGHSLEKRERKDSLYGFGGSGTFSDFKCIFDSELEFYKEIKNDKSFNLEDKLLYVQRIINHFHPYSSSPNITLPSKELELLISSPLSIHQAECWHIGSHYGPILLENIYNYLVEKQVDFIFDLEVAPNDINFDEQLIHGQIAYDELYLGLGRYAYKFYNEFFKKHGITSRPHTIQLGVRFETPFNNHIEEIAKYQYDFKLYNTYNRGVKVRTFCACHNSAYVTEEKVNGNVRYNGHGYGINNTEFKNGLTNFGIIASTQLDHPDSCLHDILHSLHQDGYCVEGEEMNFVPSKVVNVISNERFLSLYGIFGSAIDQFINDIEQPLQFGKNYRFYLPEIKPIEYSTAHNPDFSLQSYPNVHCVGDSGVGNGCRGITPAAISGLKAVWPLIKN